MKKLFLCVAAVIIAIAAYNCKGNQPEDPKVTAAKEFRAAFGPAKTDPYDIAADFDGRFKEQAALAGNPLANVLDSAENTKPTADTYGTSQYGNPENMSKLVAAAQKVINLYQ